MTSAASESSGVTARTPLRTFVVARTRTLTEQAIIDAPDEATALAHAKRNNVDCWQTLDALVEYDTVQEDTENV